MSLYSGNNWGIPQNFAYVVYDKGAEMFMSRPENKDIKINYKTGSLYKHYSEWLAQLVLKGKEPDLFLIVEEDFKTFASIGLLENLNTLIEKDPTFTKDSFYQRSLDAGSYKGGQYSLPISIVPSFLIVNKSLLSAYNLTIDQENWDWNQFYRLCRQLTKDIDQDGQIDTFGVYGYDWHQAFYTNDQTLFKPDSPRTGFSNQRMAESIDFLKKLYTLNKGEIVTAKNFEQGNVGFKVFNFSEYRAYGSYPYRILKYANFEWEAIPIPSGPHGQSSSKLYTVQVGLSSRSKHKKAAFRFMNFLTNNEEFQSEIWKQTNNLPAKRSVVNRLYSSIESNYDETKILSYPFINMIIENSYIDPNFKWYSSIDDFITQKIFQIVAKDSDTKQGVKELRDEMERKLILSQ